MDPNWQWTWQVPVVLGGIVVLIPLIFRRPALGVYVLVAAAIVFENFPLRFTDSLTDGIPFWLNLNNTANFPISANPAEIVMVVTLIATFASGRWRDRPRGPVWKAYLAFLAFVLLAEMNGLASGGDFNISLWEMRPQVYGFLLFLLAGTLIRERQQVVTLALVIILCAAFKAGIGLNRYFFTLNKDLGNAESILGHEDSYFLGLFAVATVAALIYIRRWRVWLPLLLASPLVITAMLENKRRVAVLALGVGIIVVTVVALRYEAKIRKPLAIVTAIATLAFGAFVITYWNTQSGGLAAQIIRPLRAMTGQVDQRDYLSDLYRINENADLIFTYNTSPLTGTGFGKPFYTIYPLADISQEYPLWQFIPHNSLLWVATRMGILGMAAFWALIGMIILAGLRAAQSQDDPLLRGAAAFCLAACMGELVVGYADVQLEAYRNMVFFGAMVGVIHALPRLARARAPEPAPAPVRPAVALAHAGYVGLPTQAP